MVSFGLEIFCALLVLNRAQSILLGNRAQSILLVIKLLLVTELQSIPQAAPSPLLMTKSCAYQELRRPPTTKMESDYLLVSSTKLVTWKAVVILWVLGNVKQCRQVNNARDQVCQWEMASAPGVDHRTAPDCLDPCVACQRWKLLRALLMSYN